MANKCLRMLFVGLSSKLGSNRFIKDDEVFLTFKKDKGIKNVKENLEASAQRKMPMWLNVDKDQYKAKVIRLPQREDIEYPVNEQLIVELYSR